MSESVVARTTSMPVGDSTSAHSLVDRFGRPHRALRISVTDVCNIRCQYCMPAEGVQFLDPQRLLSYAQIVRFVEVTAELGIRKLRITGGEPLMRPDLHELVGQLRQVTGIEEIALTTNGMLLERQVNKLVAAGLQRINLSLDTLSETTFKQLARREGLPRVLAGIEAARAHPQVVLKINALVLRDVNLGDVLALVEFAAERKLPLRFIEFMPLDSDRSWSASRMVSGDELRDRIAANFGPLRPVAQSDPSQPAREFELEQGGARLGFIDSVSHPFCNACDRLRLTADGKVRNCLFGREEWDVAELLRRPDATADQLRKVLHACVAAKHASHGIAEAGFQPPQRAMYQIGG